MDTLVTIEKLVHGGMGLARTDKGVLFVEDVLPGERVGVKIMGARGGQPWAKPFSIENPSPHRRRPPCAFFGQCGGCDWLHGSYDIQVSSKKEIVLDCLNRVGKIRDIPEMEVYPSPEFGYRQRVQYNVDNTRTVLGFYRRRSSEIVPITECPLLRPQLNTVLKELRGITIVMPESADQIKCIAGMRFVTASSPVFTPITSAMTTVQTGNYTFVVSGNCFFQGNAYLCEKLGSWAKDSVQGSHFVDLYGGVGFFSVFLHERFKTGIHVDNVKEHVDLAQQNFSDNGISNCRATNATAEEFLYEMAAKKTPLDCLVVDPPRAGLFPEVRQALCKHPPQSILYVSCNPATQARDVALLLKTEKYAIKKIALFDLYPNTHHMETAIVLTKV